MRQRSAVELYYLLTTEFEWTAERHRAWLTDVLRSELLGPRSE